MGNNSVPKFIFRLSRFPVYRGSVLGRFYCILYYRIKSTFLFINTYLSPIKNESLHPVIHLIPVQATGLIEERREVVKFGNIVTDTLRGL